MKHGRLALGKKKKSSKQKFANYKEFVWKNRTKFKGKCSGLTRPLQKESKWNENKRRILSLNFYYSNTFYML